MQCFLVRSLLFICFAGVGVGIALGIGQSGKVRTEIREEVVAEIVQGLIPTDGAGVETDIRTGHAEVAAEIADRGKGIRKKEVREIDPGIDQTGNGSEGKVHGMDMIG